MACEKEKKTFNDAKLKLKQKRDNLAFQTGSDRSTEGFVQWIHGATEANNQLDTFYRELGEAVQELKNARIALANCKDKAAEEARRKEKRKVPCKHCGGSTKCGCNHCSSSSGEPGMCKACHGKGSYMISGDAEQCQHCGGTTRCYCPDCGDRIKGAALCHSCKGTGYKQ